MCRNQTLKEEVVGRVKSLFSHVFIQTIEDEVNEIIYAINSDSTVIERDIVNRSFENVTYMTKYMRDVKRTSTNELEAMFQGLKLL